VIQSLLPNFRLILTFDTPPIFDLVVVDPLRLPATNGKWGIAAV
jgi:hypothetical protein